ncbi:MAG: GNAT family N-acetyltransferase [Anaerolineae bacterium]
MNVRDATVQDSAGLARVQVDSYRRAYAGIFPASYLAHFTYEAQEQDWRDLLTSATEDVLCVAEVEPGEIVGYALGRPGATEVAPYDSELVALHVRRASQGQGVGRQLLKAMAERLKQRGCASLMLWVLEENPSRVLYEHLGGRLLDAKQTSQGAVEVAYGWASIEGLGE